MLLSIIALVIGVVIISIAGLQIIKKQKKLYILLGIGILISTLSIPFLINEIYKIGMNTKKGYYTLWEAKDVLVFYGSLLSFLGTIALGSLALWQNHKFKCENDISQDRMEDINNKLLHLDSRKEKEKLFEDYFIYLDEVEKLFNPQYIIGYPAEDKSAIEIFITVKDFHLNILSKKRRLLFLDKSNIGNNFFKYVDKKTDEIIKIVMIDEDDKEKLVGQLFEYWTINYEEFNRKSLIFMTEIYSSIFQTK